MIELVFMACTINGVCRTVPMTYVDVGMLQCMIGAQAEMAKWTERHPGYEVRRWKCGVAGRYAKI